MSPQLQTEPIRPRTHPLVKRRRCPFLLLVVLVVLATELVAQQAPKHVVVHAGHLLDVKTGKLLSDQTIVIEDGRIARVGSSAEIKAPADAMLVDLSNATVLPGLIDAHVHLTADPDFISEQLGISIPREALIGAKNARITLQAGFTTVRNVGADAYADVALRDAINAGDVPGPRMLVSGPAMGITGGHCDNNLLSYEYHVTSDGVADGIAAVQQKVRQNIKYGSDEKLPRTRMERRASCGHRKPASTLLSTALILTMRASRR